MYLAGALGVEDAAGVDSSRPLLLGPFELGAEAAAEAVRILSGGEFPREVTSVERRFVQPVYWSIAHKAGGVAEVFGFPTGKEEGLPTAIEIALVKAVAASPPEKHAELLAGGVEIALGSATACAELLKVLPAGPPLVGQSLLFDGATQAVIEANASSLLTKVVLNCLANSFLATPLKFRFLEIYRMMEARFLADIKLKLIANFDVEPGASLGEAVDALKSEMNQIINLAESQQVAFESCWSALDAMRNTNRFAAALFRRLDRKGVNGGGRWRTGAALVYQVRCAIVHAGEKDIIFENFPDGDDVIEEVLPYVERAALLLVGIDLS